MESDLSSVFHLYDLMATNETSPAGSLELRAFMVDGIHLFAQSATGALFFSFLPPDAITFVSPVLTQHPTTSLLRTL